MQTQKSKRHRIGTFCLSQANQGRMFCQNSQSECHVRISSCPFHSRPTPGCTQRHPSYGTTCLPDAPVKSALASTASMPLNSSSSAPPKLNSTKRISFTMSLNDEKKSAAAVVAAAGRDLDQTPSTAVTTEEEEEDEDDSRCCKIY
jgi:hypothetical protein